MSLKTWGDDSPVLPITTEDRTGDARQLIWEMSPPSPSASDSVTRLYRHPDGLEVTVNARWSGSQWVKDASGSASRMRVEASGTVQHFHNGGGTSFSDASWTGDFSVSPDLDEQSSINSSAELVGPGVTEAFIGHQCVRTTSGNTNVGSGCTYRKRFPANPSSVTFTTFTSSGIVSQYPYQPKPFGTGVVLGTSGSSAVTVWFYGKATAS